MHVRTIQAATLGDALTLAREELGADALVLSTRDNKGPLGLKGVEITVARRDIPETTRDPAVEEDLRRLAKRVEVVQNKRKRPAPANKTTAIADLHPALRSATRAMIASGVPEELSMRFADVADRELPANGSATGLAHAAEAGISALFRFGCEAARVRKNLPAITFVVGPPGAGKSTTSAKLAAHDTVVRGRIVVMAQTDGSKVGAHHQTEIYASHIGARYAPVEDRDDLMIAIEQAGPQGHVIIDTPGIGSGDGSRLEQIVYLRRAWPDAQVLLLLPNGLHHTDTEHILKRFDRMHPTSVVLTKIDDGQRPGELLAPIHDAGLPISHFTHGHRVPDDMQTANAQTLTALLLRSGQSTREATR